MEQSAPVTEIRQRHILKSEDAKTADRILGMKNPVKAKTTVKVRQMILGCDNIAGHKVDYYFVPFMAIIVENPATGFRSQSHANGCN